MSFFRYLEVLRYVNSSPESRLRTVQIAAAFWKDNTQVSRLIHIPIIYSFANIQFLGIILDKLLNYRVIDPASIITWVFETQQSDSAYRFYAWEILQNTMSKVVARVGQVRVKLEDAEKTHKENEAKRAQEESNESKYHCFPLLSFYKWLTWFIFSGTSRSTTRIGYFAHHWEFLEHCLSRTKGSFYGSLSAICANLARCIGSFPSTWTWHTIDMELSMDLWLVQGKHAKGMSKKRKKSMDRCLISQCLCSITRRVVIS